ncbi:MAG: tRNA glutamyl-Q(34) synthetase GluQRS [Gammaproteobacteria bacterium]|nr:tRNA glutamyl-Q(34) synthetase GluQRS [Gammaproteobacteria bacterium]NND35561.1 tRNA glutamyl-Q(34) synthetase GluQRS [Gammaproteobacteria bacterium]
MSQAPAPGESYRGRFAPSPTGPLHLGSLVAAIASYLQAKVNNGEWLLRIEDIDPPREVPGASDAIIASLDAHGFEWDGATLFQSRNSQRFAECVDRLLAEDRAYACTCSREEIRLVARRGPTGAIYPGTCRERRVAPDGTDPCAIRFRTRGAIISLDDRVQGHSRCEVERDTGDFIIRRKDGLIAYNLAVVVDDSDQRISEVVRGIDLLDLTPAQISLQEALGFARPAYCHVPLVTTSGGDKLSKQTGALALDDGAAAINLCDGLAHLRQDPPRDLRNAAVTDVWAWALDNWDLGKLAERNTDREP